MDESGQAAVIGLQMRREPAPEVKERSLRAGEAGCVTQRELQSRESGPQFLVLRTMPFAIRVGKHPHSLLLCCEVAARLGDEHAERHQNGRFIAR